MDAQRIEIKRGGIKGMKGNWGLLDSFSPPKIEYKPNAPYQNIHLWTGGVKGDEKLLLQVVIIKNVKIKAEI